MKRKYNRTAIYTHLMLVFLLLLCVFSNSYTLGPKGIPLGYKIVDRGTIVASAYNSLPGQTDSSPWTTASGTRCREGVLASNHFPIGTKIYLEGEKGFNGKVFVVEDRMNKRYGKKIDIWFRHYDDAVNFGVRKVKYYVLAAA
jgi:3D (Asp-Asp-Asp) domain-containing protein